MPTAGSIVHRFLSLQASQQESLDPSTVQCKAADAAVEKQTDAKPRTFTTDDVADHATPETGIWVTYKVRLG